MKYKEHCKKLACQLSICDNAIFELLKLLDNKLKVNSLTSDELKMVEEISKTRKEIMPLIMEG